ncbi:L-rhamnose/proton symporter RhaT [Saccharicrinis aurantiacus]|uniref:L-rhamnose/proton symporter RhaT n=1 Tax=Saccharicrinis aurantiacus TaxID=1849719 RepID=UPI00094F5791|nr:L-rhamnose/proton symporter RhaT [Saccharicrinis aurantiacus]
MEFAFLPLALILFATLFQGSFGLGMKFMAPLKWEAWWLVHSLFAMIILPTIWASAVVPDLFGAIAQAPMDIKILAMLFGALWGIGGIMFGKSVPYIGMSLTYGIVLGLCAAAGSLIPFFIKDNPNMAALPYVVGGVFIMVLGVALAAYAGILRDRATEDGDSKVNLKVGIIIAVISGFLSALLGVGFDIGYAEGEGIGKFAQEAGAIARNSSLAIWVVVLWGAFILNAAYSIFLLFKNKSWSSFKAPNSGKAYMWSIIAAICWFGALGVYGQGATLMGNMGSVVGWPILMGGGLIVSNVWAYLNKEWAGAKKPFAWLMFGVAVICVGMIVIGYSNTVS